MDEIKNTIKFIFEHHTRLSCLVRFNNTPRLVHENVAEHSYYVASLAMLVADYLELQGVKLDTLRLLKMALFHDIEEAVSGDIIAPIKRGKFAEELRKLNREDVTFLMKGLTNEKEYCELWNETERQITLEAKVIKLVDRLSCGIYCIREIHLGNKYFRAILEHETANMLNLAKRIPKMVDFVKEFIAYILKYLSGDKQALDNINKAVRIFDDAGGWE